ncbi:MAG: glycosyltransferase [Parcubacteria group bacterium]
MQSSQEKSIFVDRTGKRARRLTRLAAVLALGAAVLLVAFVLSVIYAPKLAASPAFIQKLPPSLQAHLRHKSRAEQALLKRIRKDEEAFRPTALVNAAQISGAYFSPWVPGSLSSFDAHARDLTHVYPAWLELAPDGGSIVSPDWDPKKHSWTPELEKVARANGVHIVPVVSNATNSRFDARRVSAMFDDPKKARAVAQQLVDFVVANDYAGLQIDFELMSDRDNDRLVPWVRQISQALRLHGKEVSVTVEPYLPNDVIHNLVAATDYGVVMAYDEHADASDPGAIASASFIDNNLRRFTKLAPRSKLLLGVGAYGYDWERGGKEAQAVTNAEAMALAQGYGDASSPSTLLNYDPQALEPTFNYVDENGKSHEVWFLDATSVANAVVLAKDYGLRGSTLWALGDEDPASWKAFGRNASSDPDMRSVIFPQTVNFAGDGDLLSVIASPKAGSRTYERDPATGLITDETYQSYPSGWIVRRRGSPDDELALTFDDGPDPKWTPKVLAILKRHHLHATFFMVGEQAAAYPDLVKRVYADGNEIGNHSFTHPNMAHTGPERVRLELTATQRALESITGRSVTMFRPPFNADSEPGGYGEVMPMAVATQLGYLTAGESIDPTDWDLHRIENGKVRKITPNDIVRSVLAQADSGHAILLHDAGGDRSATVAALEPLIEQLQARGYRLVTMGQLIGETRAQTMPALPPEDARMAAVDGAAFTVSRDFGRFLFWGFSIAIVLGVARIALMIGLAGRPAKTPAPIPAVEGHYPRVDVLVAAYNEERVIERTVESLLASRNIDVRVIVVDDGSTDATSDVVRLAFGDNPRVTLLRKPNGGKASALNVALTQATAEVVVGVDADTQVSRTAMARLVAWFVDPSVGAVAGNVKVGNRSNIVTGWQSIEYVTSQNIDRRALAKLNAITVVPGAIGAWRRDALTAVGGYSSDTLAEDMDLTWRIRQAGWTIANEPLALAYTEAPATLGALLKQRFRWTYGTLQSLWKHRSAVFRHGWFGWLALPSLWLFQFAGQILAPFIDLQLVFALLIRLSQWISSMEHADVSYAPDPILWFIVAIYFLFIGLEVAAGWIACGFEKEGRRDLWLLPTQRLVYRQIMYLVVWRAAMRAAAGIGHAWGKLDRTGSVKVAAEA